jgi:polyisoprenoid-binding protein YceI
MKRTPFLATLVFTLSLSAGVFAQSAYQLDADQTEVSVDGTSTLHDWTMTLEKGRSAGSATFTINGASFTGIEALQLTFEAGGLKSGKVPMDNNAYRALKTDEHPEIKFEFKEMKEIKAADDGFLTTVMADLTIAGFTNPVTTIATCAVQSDTALICTGSHAIKMTDFEIDPPTVMLGSVKTGDDLTINYRAVFVK